MTVTAPHFKATWSCGFSSPNVASLRTEEESRGPGGQWRFVWGMAGKGSRIRMWRTLAVSRLIQDHWFLLLFSSSWTWSALQMEVLSHWPFSGVRIEFEGGVRRSGVPTSHSSSCSPSPLSQDPTAAASPQSPRTTPHHNRLIVGWRGGLDNPAALS